MPKRAVKSDPKGGKRKKNASTSAEENRDPGKTGESGENVVKSNVVINKAFLAAHPLSDESFYENLALTTKSLEIQGKRHPSSTLEELSKIFRTTTEDLTLQNMLISGCWELTWPLTRLTLANCKFTAHIFLDVLQKVPNLKVLHLINVTGFECIEELQDNCPISLPPLEEIRAEGERFLGYMNCDEGYGVHIKPKTLIKVIESATNLKSLTLKYQIIHSASMGCPELRYLNVSARKMTQTSFWCPKMEKYVLKVDDPLSYVYDARKNFLTTAYFLGTVTKLNFIVSMTIPGLNEGIKILLEMPELRHLEITEPIDKIAELEMIQQLQEAKPRLEIKYSKYPDIKSKILDLNDDCLRLIVMYLQLPDLVNFLNAHPRFLTFYQSLGQFPYEMVLDGSFLFGKAKKYQYTPSLSTICGPLKRVKILNMKSRTCDHILPLLTRATHVKMQTKFQAVNKFPKVRWLTLKANSAHRTTFRLFRHLSHCLQHLSCSKIDISSLNELRNLRTLRIDFASVARGGFGSVEEVLFSNTKLKTITVDIDKSTSVSNFKALFEDVENLHISTRRLEILEPMPNVKFLEFYGRVNQKTLMESLVKFKSLERVAISLNVSDVISWTIELLEQLPKLKRIENTGLKKCPLAKEETDQLKDFLREHKRTLVLNGCEWAFLSQFYSLLMRIFNFSYLYLEEPGIEDQRLSDAEDAAQ